MTISANYPTVAPSLDLDFANSIALDPRISFTRATTGTYYDGQTSAVAEQNLFANSQVYTASSWNKRSSTVTANSIVAPDGTTTASTIFETTATDWHGLFVYPPLTATTVTFSAYVKYLDRQYVSICTGGISQYTVFDIVNGTVFLNTSTGTPTITNVGSGWYRITSTGYCGSSYETTITASPATTSLDRYGAQEYAGTTTSGFYLWGCQFEVRSSAYPYFVSTTTGFTNYIPQLLTAPVNQPRFDFNPTTRASLGLLMEQQSTNLVTYSQDLSQTPWTYTDGYGTVATVTANANISPNGTLDAQLITFANSSLASRRLQTFSYTAQTYTFSVYVKQGTKAAITFEDTKISPYSGITYTFATDTITALGSAFNTGRQLVGNGWVRIYYSATYTGSGTAVIGFTSTGSVNDGTTYAWGAQLEALAFQTSYIPTVASQVTRAQDFATMTGTNFSSWFNNQQGTAYCSFDTATLTGGHAYWGIDNGASNGYLLWRTNASMQIYSAWSTVATIGTVSAINTTQQTTFSYNNISPLASAGSLNGATAVSVSSPTQLAYIATQMAIGRNGVGSPMTGHIRKFAYYPISTTATQLQSLTGS